MSEHPKHLLELKTRLTALVDVCASEVFLKDEIVVGQVIVQLLHQLIGILARLDLE